MLKILSQITRLILVIFGLIWFGVTSPVLAENSLPQPNSTGNYSGTSNHLYWQVVDSDPNGLNCRMGELSIQKVWSPDVAGYPQIGTWPVVTTLDKDEVFQAQQTYAGFVFTLDQNLNPWIFIRNKGDGTPANCFVRSNTAFVQPIAESEFKTAQSMAGFDTETLRNFDDF